MFLNNYLRNYRISLGKSVGNKTNIITEGYTDGMKRYFFFITNGKKITNERFIDGSFSSVISLVK
jgi:hypothetical protein